MSSESQDVIMSFSARSTSDGSTRTSPLSSRCFAPSRSRQTMTVPSAPAVAA